MSRAYYNECDPYAAQWIRNLIAAGHVSVGDVDERDIRDVRPDDLRGYTRCHFFAGVAVWDRALDLAGWPATRPVWTGSCPCPPFSAAGKGQRCPECGSPRNLCHPRKTGHFVCLDCGCDRHADDRHLYPEFARLIRECRPPRVFGEQVASADGRLWLAAVRADLETMGYGVGGADLCAAGLGADHIRQRLWFVADAGYGPLGEPGQLRASAATDEAATSREGRHERARPAAHRCAVGVLADTPGEHGTWLLQKQGREPRVGGERMPAGRRGDAHGLADAEGFGERARPFHQDARRERGLQPADSRIVCRLADTDGRDASAEGLQRGGQHGLVSEDGRPVHHGWPGATHDGRRDADWLRCRDGKWRPVEPGTFPLVDGAAFRLGSGSPFEGKSRTAMLKGAGNAIDPRPASAFIAAALDAACLDTLPPNPGHRAGAMRRDHG